MVGIGEAAFHMASLVAHRFSVVTTLSRSIPVIENNLLRYGLDRRCARVRASDVPVLALDDPASNARARIGAEIEQALAEDGADCIVLGCAGMADLPQRFSADSGCRWSTGSRRPSCSQRHSRRWALTSKARRLCRTRLPKTYSGMFARFAPKAVNRTRRPLADRFALAQSWAIVRSGWPFASARLARTGRHPRTGTFLDT